MRTDLKSKIDLMIAGGKLEDNKREMMKEFEDTLKLRNKVLPEETPTEMKIELCSAMANEQALMSIYLAIQEQTTILQYMSILLRELRDEFVKQQ